MKWLTISSIDLTVSTLISFFFIIEGVAFTVFTQKRDPILLVDRRGFVRLQVVPGGARSAASSHRPLHEERSVTLPPMFADVTLKILYRSLAATFEHMENECMMSIQRKVAWLSGTKKLSLLPGLLPGCVFYCCVPSELFCRFFVGFSLWLGESLQIKVST